MYGSVNVIKCLRDIRKPVDRHYKYACNMTIISYFFVTIAADDWISSTIYEACKAGYLPTMKYMVNHYNRGKGECFLRLTECCESGNLNAVRYLVHELKADPSAPRHYPIRCAAVRGQLDIVKLLVEAGANIHNNMDQPLQWASQKGHMEVCKYLLSKGAIVYDDHIRYASDPDIIKLLKAHKK